LNERIKLLDDAGIKPDIVDAEVIALTNAFKAFSGKNLHEMKTYGLLHIGHHASLAMIVQNGEPFFAREIAAGVESAEQAAAEAIAQKAIRKDFFIAETPIIVESGPFVR
jgi:Tfp pilus assembly PilM family ATPase